MSSEHKKIALLSCHDDPNYGSMLQAYALVMAIKKLGKDAEYISYTIEPVPNSLDTFINRFVKLLLSCVGLYHEDKEWDFLKMPEFALLMQSFKRFHEKYIPFTKKIYYADRLKKDFCHTTYENFIVGSDQSWSPNIYHHKKPYFLDFAPIKHKQSYAPSLGTIRFTEEYRNLLKEKLSSFEHISCREKVNAEMLTELLGKKVCHVLDPTLLLEQSDWNKIAITPKINKPYILAYILGEKDSVVSFAERLGAEKHIPVYYVLTRPKYLAKENLIPDAGPDDFVGLIKNAEYIVTDSYHGCLFSINYNRNFYAFSKKGGDISYADNIRILEFLQQIGLQSRFLNSYDASLLPDIDYKYANSIISKLRIDSLSYLKDIL